nr:DUF1501 domain-containing protein [Mycolicibacterium mengxianglii]
MSASLPVTREEVRRLSNEMPLAPSAGILVLVTLYGGNDGINTLIPYTNNAYQDSRPELAYSAEDVIDLDGEYGFNPGLKGLGELFDDGSLAVVRGVGYPEQDRSHFRSMDIWQTASTDNGVSTGWIGRWLDLKAPNPLRAISVGSALPTLAIGSQRTAATLSPDSLASITDNSDLMSELGEPDPEDTEAMVSVRDSYSSAANVSRQFDGIINRADKPQTANIFNVNTISGQLNIVSRCIRAGLPTQVYCVSLDGFDTHANEKTAQEKLLRAFDRSLTKFLKEISGAPRGKNVVVMAYSEFGRRVAANASDGTDHGTSGPVFVAGAPVRGGFYGDNPSLTDLTHGDLKTTTDFRDLYGELLATTLAVDPASIIGGKRKPIGFLS